MSSASERRCHYEVLGLERDCTADAIRSAYRKLALLRHPDKLVKSGLDQADATAQFQELAHAYEVLSDPKERAWYDSHRHQILFADRKSANSGPDSAFPDLFSFFSASVFSGYSDSGRGFYKVYADVFNKIYANELRYVKKVGLGLDSVPEAPAMGNLGSPYAQVTAFYNYWFGFCTVMEFVWVDQYDATAGLNRKSRRVMEEENKKLRKKAKREYNDTVRGLAEFVKKRDKRVMDMMVKKEEEREKKRVEEKERKKKLEREKLERAMAYEEPDWAKVAEDGGDEVEDVEEEEEEEEEEEDMKLKELYCVVCGKKFKSEKQWKNHEQSKKHKEKVAEFRESIGDEELDEEEVSGEDGEERGDVGDIDEIVEEIKEGLKIEEEEDEVGVSDGDDEFYDVVGENGTDKVDAEAFEFDGDDAEDDLGALAAMVAKQKSRKNAAMRVEPEEESLVTDIHVENDGDKVEPMEYDNRKSKGRKARKKNKNGGQTQEIDEDDKSQIKESTSNSGMDDESNDKGGDKLPRKNKSSSKNVDKKENVKKEANNKSKSSSKGKKSKAASKNSSNTCEGCGEEFESRNRLHTHLSDSGHAKLKSR